MMKTGHWNHEIEFRVLIMVAIVLTVMISFDSINSRFSKSILVQQQDLSGSASESLLGSDSSQGSQSQTEENSQGDQSQNGKSLQKKNWRVATTENKLELSEDLIYGINRETLRNVTKVIGKNELDALADGAVTNKKGVTTHYSQFLYLLGDGSQSKMDNGYVIYGQNQDDKTADFLFFMSGTEIGRYLLQFNTPFESNMDQTGQLPDIRGAIIKIFGKDYTIIGSSRISDTPNGLYLTLLSRGSKGMLVKNQTRIYHINGKDYEVKLDALTQVDAQFIVNGQKVNITVGNVGKLVDGTQVGLESINVKNHIAQSAVFYLGPEKIELADRNVADAVSSNTLKVNDETINDALVVIEGKVQGAKFQINKIHINMTAYDDFYVPAGGNLSSIPEMRHPQVLFTQNWDIQYQGLTKKALESIKVAASSPNQYNLEFVDGDGHSVNVPIARAGSGSQLQMGDVNNRALINVEKRTITKYDYFILTNSNQPRGQRKTYALQYIGADKITADSPAIRFRDLGTGTTFEQHFANNNLLSALRLGNSIFRIYKSTKANLSFNDFDIQIDLNGNGLLDGSGDFVPITSSFGAEINLSNLTSNRVDFKINTPDNKKDINAMHSVNTLQPSDISGDITAKNGTVNAEYNGNIVLRIPSGSSTDAYGYTSYGTFIKFVTPPAAPSTLSLDYPKNQNLPQVFIVTK